MANIKPNKSLSALRSAGLSYEEILETNVYKNAKLMIDKLVGEGLVDDEAFATDLTFPDICQQAGVIGIVLSKGSDKNKTSTFYPINQSAMETFLTLTMETTAKGDNYLSILLTMTDLLQVGHSEDYDPSDEVAIQLSGLFLTDKNVVGRRCFKFGVDASELLAPPQILPTVQKDQVAEFQIDKVVKLGTVSLVVTESFSFKVYGEKADAIDSKGTVTIKDDGQAYQGETKLTGGGGGGAANIDHVPCVFLAENIRRLGKGIVFDNGGQTYWATRAMKDYVAAVYPTVLESLLVDLISFKDMGEGKGIFPVSKVIGLKAKNYEEMLAKAVTLNPLAAN